MIVAFAVGLLLSALNVRYRDVNQAITLLVSLWLFLSPVAYPVVPFRRPGCRCTPSTR